MPLLISTLGDPKDKVRERVAQALGEIGTHAVPPLIDALKREQTEVRRGALDALARIGPGAAPAIPALLDLVRDEMNPGVQRFGAEALGQIGKPAIEALAQALASAPPEYAARLAQALGVIGVTAQASVGELQRALKHNDARVRREAVWALGRIPPLSGEVPALLEALTVALRDTDDRVREQAALALGRLGKSAAPTIPALVKLLQDNDATIRQVAAFALGEVIPPVDSGTERKIAFTALGSVAEHDSAAAVRAQAWRSIANSESAAVALALVALTRGLADAVPTVQVQAAAALTAAGSAAEPLIRTALTHDRNPLVRRAAFQTLLRLKPKWLIDMLTEALTDKDWEISKSAAETLGTLGKEAEPAVPALCVALRSKVNVLREAALKTLAVLDPEATRTVPALQEALVEKAQHVRAWAAEQLGKFGAKAVGAAPLLVLLTSSWRGGVSHRAAAALKLIGPPAVPHITAALMQKDTKVREAVFEGLRSIDWQIYNVLQPYKKQMGSPPPDVKEKMKHAFAEFGGASSTSLEGLLKRLEDKQNWRTRYDAAIALGKLGKDAVPAIAPLTKALEDRDNDVREQSATVLGLIGAEAKSAAEALTGRLQDGNKRVQVAAMLALSRIGHTTAAAMERLIELLDNEHDATLVRLAAELMGRQGKQATPALDGLRVVLRNDDANVRTWAIWAPGQIGTAAQQALPDVERVLNTPHPRVQAWAAGVYYRISGQTEPALRVLPQVLPCREHDIRVGAADAVLQIGEPALALLMTCLTHPDARYRAGAVETLGLLGKKATSATTALTEVAANDPNSEVLRLAAEALTKVKDDTTNAAALIPATELKKPETA